MPREANRRPWKDDRPASRSRALACPTGDALLVALRRQPVGDGRGAAWIGHGRRSASRRSLVAEADAFVLAQVFIPGADDELLEHAPGVGSRRATRASSPRPCGVGRGARRGARRRGRCSSPGLGRYSTVTSTGPSGSRRVDELRVRPVAGRQQVVRGDRPERQPQRRRGRRARARRRRRGARRSARRSVRSTPNAALPSAPPPWKITR